MCVRLEQSQSSGLRLRRHFTAMLCASDVKKAPLADFARYRNSCPFVFDFDGAVDGAGLVSLLEVGDRDVVCDVLIANDGRSFLKHELTRSESAPLHSSLLDIMGASDFPPPQRRYLRAYLDSVPSWQSLLAPILKRLEAVTQPEEAFKDKSVGVWCSSAGCQTPLHFDLCHGFLLQQQGCKTFWLAPPADTSSLYWRPSEGRKNQTTSEVDFFRWKGGDSDQQKRFPELDGAAWRVARLGPGVGLYTPPGWWHAVLSETISVSLLAPLDPAGESEIRSLPLNVKQLN